jgi:hypothetical protein
MPRREQLIANWRKTMMTARGLRGETLEELENHLRETVEQNQRSGMSETEAFERAAAQIGPPPKITSEFEKVNQSTWWPVKAAIVLEVVAAIAVVMAMLVRFSGTGPDLVLLVHVLTVTVGYVATLLIGGVAICYVVQRCFADLSPARLQSLSRFTLGFGSLAAGFTLVGIVLGMIWAKPDGAAGGIGTRKKRARFVCWCGRFCLWQRIGCAAYRLGLFCCWASSATLS